MPGAGAACGGRCGVTPAPGPFKPPFPCSCPCLSPSAPAAGHFLHWAARDLCGRPET